MLDLQIVNAMGVMFDALHGCKSSDWNALSCHISSFSPSPICLPLCCRRQRSPPYGPWRVLWPSFSTAAPPMTARERLVSYAWHWPSHSYHALRCRVILCAVLIWKGRHLLCLSDMRRSIFHFFQEISQCSRSPYIHFNDAYSVFSKLSGAVC